MEEASLNLFQRREMLALGAHARELPVVLVTVKLAKLPRISD
jgi:hypothetical protein